MDCVIKFRGNHSTLDYTTCVYMSFDYIAGISLLRESPFQQQIYVKLLEMVLKF